MTGFPWSPGAATGVGSLPGVDPAEAVRTVLDELPDLPHLPELPDRGPGADMIGRGAVFLVDLAVDLQPSGWRLVDRAGVDLRRARDFLARDLDALAQLAEGWAGPLKLQVAGPLTLAGSVELHRGDKAVADAGATRDLAQSLAEGVRRHLAEVARRLPSATLLLQVDEPALPVVLSGRVPTASGYGALRAVQPAVAEGYLGAVLDAASPAFPVVHCCADRPPLALLHAAGARALSVDVARLGPADDEALGTALTAGVAFWPGAVPAVDATLPSLDGTLAPARRLCRRLGLDPGLLRAAAVVTPACGLAGATPVYARAALRRAREAGRALADDPEG